MIPGFSTLNEATCIPRLLSLRHAAGFTAKNGCLSDRARVAPAQDRSLRFTVRPECDDGG